MNFLQRIYKSEVIYEPNQKLEIKPAYFIRYFPVVFLSCLIGLVATSNFSFISILFGIIFLFQYVNIFKAIEAFSVNGKENLLLIPNQPLPIIRKNEEFLNLDKNNFLQLFIKLRKHSVNIIITNGAVEIGKYRLNSTEDLKNVLDGLIEIADLEMVESFNTSKGEILQLKAKNKLLQSFSSLNITERNQVINISSIPDMSIWLHINKKQNHIKTRYKTYEILNIERLLIQRKRNKVSLFIVLKNKTKRVKIFTHKPVEVVAITDVRKLVDLLKKEVIFNNIPIEVIN